MLPSTLGVLELLDLQGRNRLDALMLASSMMLTLTKHLASAASTLTLAKGARQKWLKAKWRMVASALTLWASCVASDKL